MLTQKLAAETLARRDAHVARAGVTAGAGQIVLAFAYLILTPRTPLHLTVEVIIIVLNVFRLTTCGPGTSLRPTWFGRTIDVYAVLVASVSFAWMTLFLGILALPGHNIEQTLFVILTIIGFASAGAASLALKPWTYRTLVTLTAGVPTLDLLFGPDQLTQWNVIPYGLLLHILFLLRQSRHFRLILEESIRTEVRSNVERDNLSVILDASPNAILSLDKNLKVVAVNHVFCAQFGLRRDEIIDRPLSAERISPTVIDNITTFLDSDLNRDQIELTIAVANGLRRFTVLKRRLDNPLIHGMVIFQDVEDERQAEAALLEQQALVQNSSKLVALGTMAGGIAHEINNPLAIISGRVQAIRHQIERDLLDPVTLNGHFETVVRTVDRIAKIIKGLRQMARDGTGDPLETVSVSQLVEDFVPLVDQFLAAHDIELRVRVDVTLRIPCRVVEISQVLLNLVTNATDVVVDHATPRWIEIAARGEGEFAAISITDSGAGIPVALREKIMVPFFTTKGVGQGTGIGLSISRGIAEAHGGRLELDTTCANTRFVMFLPRVGASAAS